MEFKVGEDVRYIADDKNINLRDCVGRVCNCGLAEADSGLVITFILRVEFFVIPGSKLKFEKVVEENA